MELSKKIISYGVITILYFIATGLSISLMIIKNKLIYGVILFCISFFVGALFFELYSKSLITENYFIKK